MKHVALITAIFVALASDALADFGSLARYHATIVNGNLLGSSFELQDGLIATNAHVVEGKRVGSTVRVFIPGQKKYANGVLVAVSRRMDLALLKLPAELLQTPQYPRTSRETGRLQLVGVVANRGPQAVRMGSGYVVQNRVNIPSFGPGMILRTNGVTFGFSGGPVFNGQDQVIGMTAALRNHSGRTETLVISIAAIREEARRMLRQN